MRYNYTEIGDRIRQLRKSSKKNQDDFIEELKKYGVNIARNRLSGIENGEKKAFSLELLLAVCEIFGCDMGYLLGEYSEKTKEIHEICSVTGLNESAVERLFQWSQMEYQQPNFSIINGILTSNEFLYLLSCISDYKTAYTDLLHWDKIIKIVRSDESDCDNPDTIISKDKPKHGSPFEDRRKCDMFMFRIQECIKDIVTNIVKESV